MADGPLTTGPPFFHKSRFALGIAAILLAATYQSKLYFTGFALLAIGLAFVPHALLLSRIRVETFMASSLTWWILLLILTTLLLPGVSYLLTWPVLFCLPGFAYLSLAGG